MLRYPTQKIAYWYFVSALVLRGRLREAPWWSFFTWGWRGPLDWWRAFRDEGPDYRAPTAMVDLAKPAFKLGVAQLKVGLAEHELQVTVTADQPQYAVRQKAKARIKALRASLHRDHERAPPKEPPPPVFADTEVFEDGDEMPTIVMHAQPAHAAAPAMSTPPKTPSFELLRLDFGTAPGQKAPADDSSRRGVAR